MSAVQPPLVSGMVLGGVLISALGAGSTIFVEEKRPTTKSLSRDFLIGAIMVAMILQLLPESTTGAIEFLMGLVPTSLLSFGSAAAAVGAAGATSSLAGADEWEVKVGVPRF